MNSDPAPTLRFVPGQILLGRFKLIRLLGEGGMGQVWRVSDLELQEDAAVKILKSNLAADPYQIDLLRNECRNARRLVHPNIIRIHDFHRSGNLAFISMEYVAGENLNDYRKRLGRLDPEDTLNRLVPVAEALSYAHGRGVVHRDVKPANILIDRNQNARLSDFGIAGVLRDTGPTLRITTGGSSYYMSPEQLSQDAPRPADDIYALGAVMYDMLCGRPPFYPHITDDRILKEIPLSVNQQLAKDGTDGRVPAALNDLVQKLLAKTGHQRPRTMSRVAAAMGRALTADENPADQTVAPSLQPPGEPPGESRPIEAVDVRSGEALAAGAGRNWTKGVILAAALALVFVGGAWVLRYLATNPVYVGDNGVPKPEPKPPAVYKIPDRQKQEIAPSEPEPAVSAKTEGDLPQRAAESPEQPNRTTELEIESSGTSPMELKAPAPESELEPTEQDVVDPKASPTPPEGGQPVPSEPDVPGPSTAEPAEDRQKKPGMAQPLPMESAEPSIAEPVEVSRPEAERVQPAAYKAMAEAAMAIFVGLKNDLDQRQAEQWGGEAYARMADSGATADDHMVNRRYKEAAGEYTAAEKMARELDARSAEILEIRLAEGQQALENGDAATARDRFTTALLMAPDNLAAKSGLARAEALEAVTRLLASAEALEKAGRLALALADYQAAFKQDGRSAEAKSGVARITSRIAEQSFQTLMSAGMTALHENAFAAARSKFQQALALKPGSPAVADALAQVEAAEKLMRIEALKQKAETAEGKEDWQQALALYRQALGEDDTLRFARQGRDRTERHLSLARRMKVYLDDPVLLEKDAHLERALVVLEDARKAPLGGEKLKQQLEMLDQRIRAAQTPVKVVLRSDNETDVAVYKVGKFGRFETRELDLRPGRYTVVGARMGYKDVRLSIHVPAGEARMEFNVQCTEKI